MPRDRGRFLLARACAATVALATAATQVGAGCLDRPDVEELIAQPVIVTKRDPGADFATPATFAVTDTIPLLPTFDAGASATTVDPALASPMLGEIAVQLSRRGYRQVARDEGPDLGVAVTAVNRLRIESFSYGGWWGAGAATSAYWGYSGAQFGAPLAYSSVAWQSGTLIIELYDLRAARDEAGRPRANPTVAVPTITAPISILWAAIIHGVVGGFGASLDAPPLDAIRQAFDQSPYLTRSPAQAEVP